MTATTIASDFLLTDEQMIEFVVSGYHLVEPDLPDGFNEAVCAELDALEENPLDAIVDRVPRLRRVHEHPAVTGALASVLGEDFAFSNHCHWHAKAPGSPHMQWHQDSVNDRDVTALRKVLVLYYPHDVTAEMGPTVVVPGTHFRNAPTDRMATYGNIRGQVPLTVKAGTVAITAYPIWHGTGPNRTGRTRHMVKAPVLRTREPAAPSWRHDPERAAALVAGGAGGGLSARLVTARPVPVGQSDHYKARRLRRETWGWLCGQGAPGSGGGG